MNKNTQSKKTSKAAFWHLVKYVFLSIVFVVGILGMASTRPPDGPDGPDGIEIQKVYILAFAEAGSNRIQVCWSKDGQTWSSSSNFPSQTTSLGIGATSSAVGLINLVFWADASNKLQAVWGLGPDGWDNRPAGPSLTQSLLSAPTAAYAGESLYLVAFRAEGDMVAVRALNSSTRKWLSISIAPAHNNNSNVLGSPAIAILNGKVVLAWRRSGTMEIARGDLQITTVGGEKVPIVNWTNIYTFSLTESGYGYPRSDPALTQDGSNFYLGFVRRTTGGPLQADWLFVHPSNDGVTWGTPIKKGNVPLYALVNISARSDGSLLAAFIGPSTGPSKKRALYKYAGGTWTEILETTSSSSPDAVFGSLPSLKKFALITNKP